MAGGWERSDGQSRKSELPSNWSALRAECKRLAGGQCSWRLPSGKRCPRPGSDADHIGRPEDHRQSNLRWLCATHHGKRTARQANAARAKRWSKRPRNDGPDPGRLG